MKLEDAAIILGVSADADIDTLKQKYKKLNASWAQEKVKNILL